MHALVIIFGSLLICFGVVWATIGKATAARIAGKDADAAFRADVEASLAELDHLRERVLELEERVDFAERMLARPEETVRLPAGEDR